MSDDARVRGFVERGSSDDDTPCYTLVETAYGHLYVVLIPSIGKLLYDEQSLTPTATDAEAALRKALEDGPDAGEEPQATPRFVPPEKMLTLLMTALVQG